MVRLERLFLAWRSFSVFLNVLFLFQFLERLFLAWRSFSFFLKGSYASVQVHSIKECICVLKVAGARMAHSSAGYFFSLHQWRYYIAREQDESTGYVLPNMALIEIGITYFFGSLCCKNLMYYLG